MLHFHSARALGGMGADGRGRAEEEKEDGAASRLEQRITPCTSPITLVTIQRSPNDEEG